MLVRRAGALRSEVAGPRTAGDRRRTSTDVNDVLDALARAGLTKFVATFREL